MAAVAAVVLVLWAIGSQEPLGTVRGVVLLSNGNPAGEGASVYVGSANGATDRSGRFIVRKVPVGTHDLRVMGERVSGRLADVEVREGAVTEVTVKLEPFQPFVSLMMPAQAWSAREHGVAEITGAFPAETQEKADLCLRIERIPIEVKEVLGSPFTDVLLSPPAWLARAVRQREVLHELSVRLTAKDWEGTFSKSLRLPQLPAGAYLITGSFAGLEARAAVTVTDLALIAQTDGEKIVAFAARAADGEPVAGAQVRIAGSSSLAYTDRNGVASLKPPPVGQDAYVVADSPLGPAMAYLGEWAFAKGIVGCIYADRTVYRPGQTVHFRGVVRQPRGKGYAVPTRRPIQVRLEDAAGAVQDRIQCTTTDFGTFSGILKLSSEASTGPATIFATGPGVELITELPVVAYRKPILSVRVEPRAKHYLLGDTATFDIHAAYFYGAPVADAEVTYSARLDSLAEPYELQPGNSDVSEPEAGSPGEDAYTLVSEDLVAGGSGRTDAAGHLRVTVRLPRRVQESCQKYRLVLTGTVVDVSKQPEDFGRTVPVYQALGVMRLQPANELVREGEPARVRVTLCDLSGMPLRGAQVRLEAALTDEDDPRARAIRLVSSARTDARGNAETTFRLHAPGEWQIAAFYRDPEGRTLQEDTFLSVCPRKEGGDKEFSRTDLSVTTNKRRYRLGETALVLIRTNRVGATVLLTVSSRNIEEVRTLRLDRSALTVPVRIAPNMNLGATITVCCIHDRTFTSSEVQVRVNRPMAVLQLSVKPERESYRPRENAVVTLRTLNALGRPVSAEASVAVVDEAVYRVREDDPDLLKTTFWPWPLPGVVTAHSCEEYGLLDASRQSVKGVAESAVRRRFEDTAYWNAHVRTDRNGYARLSLRLPDNIGQWRVTARAVTLQTQLGYGRARFTVRLPFHVQLETPRFLTVGDQTNLTAVLRNGTQQALDGIARLVWSGRSLAVNDLAARRFAIRPRSTTTVSWSVTARSAGAERLRLEAVTAAPHLADAVETSLRVVPCARLHRWTWAGTLPESRRHEVNIAPEATGVPAGITLRVAPTVLAAVGPGLEYLIAFPYGCTEQTVSSFLPDLLVARLLLRATPAARRELERALPRASIQQLPAMVRSGISRLNGMYSNGWNWWHSREADPWLTAYATMALAEAHRDGYDVPEKLASGAVAVCANLAKRAEPDTAAFLSFAAAGFGHTNVTKPRLSQLDVPGLAWTVLEAGLKGERTPRSEEAYRRLLRLKVGSSGNMVYWKVRDDNTEWYTDTACTALALRAILVRSPRAPEVVGALNYLMAQRTGEYWTSTKDTAFVLLALAEYIRHFPRAAVPGGEVVLRINGNEVGRVRLSQTDGRLQEMILQRRFAGFKPGRNTVEVVKRGLAAPFYSLLLTAYHSDGLASPVQKEPGLTLQRTYEILAPGERISRGAGPLGRPLRGPVASGTTIRVRLMLKTESDLRFVLLTDRLPAGAEPLNSSTDAMEYGYWYDHMDVRDDHVAVFARALRRGEYVAEYCVQTVRPGHYTALPARAECMYQPTVWAEAASQMLTIR